MILGSGIWLGHSVLPIHFLVVFFFFFFFLFLQNHRLPKCQDIVCLLRIEESDNIIILAFSYKPFNYLELITVFMEYLYIIWQHNLSTYAS